MKEKRNKAWLRKLVLIALCLTLTVVSVPCPAQAADSDSKLEVTFLDVVSVQADGLRTVRKWEKVKVLPSGRLEELLRNPCGRARGLLQDQFSRWIYHNPKDIGGSIL